MVSLILHAFWFAVAIWILAADPRDALDPWVYGLLPDCPQCDEEADAILYASELGRLDLISLILTLLGLLFAPGSFAGFFLLRNYVIIAAQEEVHRQMPRLAAAAIERYMTEHGPALMERWAESSPGSFHRLLSL